MGVGRSQQACEHVNVSSRDYFLKPNLAKGFFFIKDVRSQMLFPLVLPPLYSVLQTDGVLNPGGDLSHVAA